LVYVRDPEFEPDELPPTPPPPTMAGFEVDVSPAGADIYLDGSTPFYGVSVLEASAFEMPVISGLNKFAREYMKEHDISCPYSFPATFDGIKDKMRDLILDPSLREVEGKQGYEFAKRMHSPEVVVDHFLGMIE